MRILLIGAYGFIGNEIARGLLLRGHEVRGFGRDIAYGRRILPDMEWMRGDLADFTDPGSWALPLAGADAVVNASGLLQDEPGHAVAQIQHHAIAALITASSWAGVSRFIQISAANAEVDAPTIFLRSKAAADQALRVSELSHLILRPGLVIARNAYGGTELIRMAAAMPFATPLPGRTGSIQCIGMADLVEAVLHGLDPDGPVGTVDLVEQRARPLAGIVALHRKWLGLSPVPVLLIAAPLLASVGFVADLLGRLGWRSPLRTTALVSLAHGVSGDAGQAGALLGRVPSPLEAILAARPAGRQDRIAARLNLLFPVLLAALFLMWFGSALFGFRSIDAAARLLTEAGIGESIARLFVLSGSMADGVLALMLLHRRTARLALWGMIAVTLVYLGGATLVRPDLWIDPLAPLLKTLPAAMLALVCLTLLDRR